MPKLYRTIGGVVLGCVAAAGLLGVGLSAIINASLSQSGSDLDVLFRGDSGTPPHSNPNTPIHPGN